ncbi:response regulator [Neptuniibacter sp. QD72_48]|uniref:response regulator n=1 Tax=unclassified Neptuniibacter TaxID=2630693 RepID=UPI0039F62456
MKLLLIEDDPLIGHGVSQAMTESNQNIEWIQQAAGALDLLKSGDYDALLLDLGLPDLDGFEILRQIRQAGLGIPVIIITARDGVDDRINGLDLGADDYLIKPFSIAELQARLRAISRRNQGAGTPVLETSSMKLDVKNATVIVERETYQLSAREFALLETLMMRAGQTFNREQLESKVYGLDDDIASNAIEFIIHGLRKKLGKGSIKNIRGLGWMVQP